MLRYTIIGTGFSVDAGDCFHWSCGVDVSDVDNFIPLVCTSTVFGNTGSYDTLLTFPFIITSTDCFW